MREVQARRKRWSYNVIRPNAIIGFSPRGQTIHTLRYVLVHYLTDTQQMECPKS